VVPIVEFICNLSLRKTSSRNTWHTSMLLQEKWTKCVTDCGDCRGVQCQNTYMLVDVEDDADDEGLE